jgi:hypothetical protein
MDRNTWCRPSMVHGDAGTVQRRDVLILPPMSGRSMSKRPRRPEGELDDGRAVPSAFGARTAMRHVEDVLTISCTTDAMTQCSAS